MRNLGVVDQELFKVANRKQQNTDDVFLLAENCDIRLKILHKHYPFEPIRDPDNCDVRVFFLWTFFTWPRNYYDNNVKNISNLTNMFEEYLKGKKDYIQKW